MGISMYDAIWNGLKASDKKPKQISITANKLLHPRILKAVSKRKNLDIGYKLLLEPRTAILYHESTNSILTFYLNIYPIPPITIEDL